MEKSKMILQAAFLFLISGTLGFEVESCNSIVQPLLKLLDNYQTKHLNFSELQDNLSEAQNRLYNVHLKYSELLEKYLASQDNLANQITEKNAQIKLLNDRISDLEKASKLKEMTKSGQEVIIGNTHNDSKIEEKSKEAINEDKSTYKVPSLKIFCNDETNTATSPSSTEASIEVLLDGSSSSEEDDYYGNTEIHQTIPSISETPIVDRCPSPQNGSYSYPQIKMPGFEPFRVSCFSDRWIGSGWMKVQYRLRGSRKFNRKYEEYINGFGDLQDEMFIGLEKLHILTNWKPHEVYLYQMGLILQCQAFVVGDKSEGYSLKKLDGCTGDPSHYNLIQGTKFSTYDRDEDGNPDTNWAKELGYGWWFNSRKTPFQERINSFYFYIRRKD